MALEYDLREFTVDEYHRMAEAGILQPEERVELLDGRLVRMSPIGYRHSGLHMSITAYLQRVLPDAAVAGQASFPLGTQSEPLPDIAILAQRRSVYLQRPAAASELLVVIEIAESSLAKDLGPKRALYARSRVPEYLVVDVDRNVLLYLAAPNDVGYAETSTLGHGETLTLRAFPSTPLAVSELLLPQ